MNANSSCPCCSRSMLLHLSSRRSFWLCSHCRIEIPDVDLQHRVNKTTTIEFNSSGLQHVVAPLKSTQPAVAI